MTAGRPEDPHTTGAWEGDKRRTAADCWPSADGPRRSLLRRWWRWLARSDELTVEALWRLGRGWVRRG